MNGMWQFGGNVELAGAATQAPPAPSAISAPAPRTGEVRRTALQDDFSGIRFEIARMVKYVQEARSDPIIIDTARLTAAHWGKMVEEAAALRGKPISSHNSKIIQLEGIDIWCRAHFCYLNDGANVEVIQTPSRMARATRVGKDVLKGILAPFYAAMEASGAGEAMRGYEPPPIFTGDCDEAATMVCAMAAALDITPVAFRFGGSGGTLHHVWSRIGVDGEWWDCDVTEPGFKLGDVSEFETYEQLDVEL